MPFAACPKCAHAPLPEDQALPAACPACGLVLAKYGAPLAIARTVEGDESSDERSGAHERSAMLSDWLLRMPDEVSRINWTARVATLIVFSAWTLWIWRDVDIAHGKVGSNFLHTVLLPFHEAGHYAIFRWFGPFLMTLGGSLAQLLMPIVVGASLLVKRRDAFGAALFAWLLGFATIDMAVYMYDAFDPQLMLLGGKTGAESDGHDWQNTFGDLGILHRARGIGQFFGVLGGAMMLGALAWAAWVLKHQRQRLSDSVLAETDLR